MSTQRLRSTTDAESTTDQTITDRTAIRPRTTPSSAVTEDARTATDRAPRTFSHRNAARLENLIDEWNAAFANESADEAA